MITLEEKFRARNKLRWAVNSGKIKPLPCQRCGAVKTFAHHLDYRRPLLIEWLCRPCHSEVHRKHPLAKICAVCRKEFTPPPSKRARNQTCGPACRYLLVAAVQWNNRKRDILKCAYCGENYEVEHYRKNVSVFCSRQCRGKWHRGKPKTFHAAGRSQRKSSGQ